jgi:hypothetical protein
MGFSYQNRQVHIDSPEETAAKTLYVFFISKERSEYAWLIPASLTGTSYEVQEALFKLTEKNFQQFPCDPDAFWLMQRVKDFMYPEKTRRRLAADERLKEGAYIPVPVFSNTRAIEAQKRADMLSDDYCERFLEVAIMQSRRRCLDKHFGVYETFDSFEDREMAELQQRGVSPKLARFMIEDWELGKDSEAQRDWERFSSLQKNEARIDYLNLSNEYPIYMPKTDILELGTFSPSALRNALISLFPNADLHPAPKKKDEFRLMHLCHDGEWVFFSVGNGQKPEPTTARAGQLSLPDGQYFHCVFALEGLVNINITKKGSISQLKERGILDVEVETNEDREKAEKKLNATLKKRGWKQVKAEYQEDLIALAIDFKTATLIIRSAGGMQWESHYKMLTAERRQECANCSGNGIYFNDNNPAHKCEVCGGVGSKVVKA